MTNCSYAEFPDYFSGLDLIELSRMTMDIPAAGDVRFFERAEARLKDFIGRSRILAMASHSSELVRSMCNKAALMVEGQILMMGAVESASTMTLSCTAALREASRRMRCPRMEGRRTKRWAERRNATRSVRRR
jgi:Fe-S cluster assembly ATPase SufC